MAEIFRSLRSLILCLLADQDEFAKCYEDSNYVYFMYREDNNWYGAEKKCRSNSFELATTTSAINECVRQIYREGDSVTVWRERIPHKFPDVCYYTNYNASTFTDSWTHRCTKSYRKSVCYSEKLTQETLSTSTSTLAMTRTGTEIHTPTIVASTRLRTTHVNLTATSGTTPFVSSSDTQATERTTKQSSSLSITEAKEMTPLEHSYATASTKEVPVKHQTCEDLQTLSGGAIGGIVIGVLLFCIAVAVGFVFIIRRRNQQSQHKEQTHALSNVTYGIHSPDIVPLQGSSQDRHTDAGYFEVEPHSIIQGSSQENGTYHNIRNENRLTNDKSGNDSSETMEDESKEENVQLSSSQLVDNIPNTVTHATSVEVPATDTQQAMLTASADTDDNHTYDHTNKQASPVHNVNNNVYCHTYNDMGDKYSHTNIKAKKGDDADSICNDTEPDLGEEYSTTNSTPKIGQSSPGDDTYRHTNGQSPVAGEGGNSELIHN